jgi:hypothetical protein
MNAARTSETSVYSNETSRRYIPEGSHLVIDVRIDVVRVRLWTAATNERFVLSSGDMWAWRATVEWYWQGKPAVRGLSHGTAFFVDKDRSWLL